MELAISELPLEADMLPDPPHVGFVPQAELKSMICLELMKVADANFHHMRGHRLGH
jgi:hypothetical protein